MNRTLLNIGCGEKKLPGFINIDLEPGADLQCNVTKGLPFENNSVHGIFSEHFFEHITQAQGAAFLRECRRILIPGGVIRIATPDLDALIDEYSSEHWLHPEWAQFGYNYLDNRCEMLNLALREWGHQWVYNEEELVRVGELSGLAFSSRCQIGESKYEHLRGLEYRAGSRLIVEFVKSLRERSDNQLVSILIPSFKPEHFSVALESALNQSYANIEIVISDDCPTDEIESLTSQCSDSRIRYFKNRPALGSLENHLRTFELAKGRYIKFLCDDDLLYPSCVETMVQCFEQNPGVTLVTSHRQCIDAGGKHLPDIAATQRIVKENSLIDGVHLANAMLSNQLNIVGEPTTVMFRREDLQSVRPNFLSFGGRQNIGNGDMTMWLNLLSKGDAIYLVDTLSYFRQHDSQEQRQEDYARRGGLAIQQLVFDAKRFGFLSEYTVQRPMSRPLRVKSNIEVKIESILNESHADLVLLKLERLLTQQPENSHVHNAIGVQLYERGEKEKALQSFVHAAKFDPRNVDAQRNLADAAIEAGRLEKAMHALQAILDVAPNDVESLLKLGNLSCMIRRFNDASFFYRRVLSIDKNHENAQQMLTELEAQGLLSSQRKGERKHTASLLASIVIPVHNQLPYTKKCIRRIFETTKIEAGVEIIIVDNGSTDGTGQWLREAGGAYPNLSSHRNEENLGFGAACNRGARSARGKYIVFLNNDTEPHEGWLEAMIEVAEHEPKVGIVGSKLIYPDGTVQHAGIAFSMRGIDGVNVPYPFHQYRGVAADDGRVGTERDVVAVTGACLLISSELFASVGGFDEGFKMYFEDIDLCLKVAAQEKRIVYTPKSVVVHHEGKSSPNQTLINEMNAKSARRFYARWGEQLNEMVKSQREVATEVVWAAPFFNPSGYASEAINFVLPLDGRVPVRIVHQNNIISESFCNELPAYVLESLDRFQTNAKALKNFILISHNPAHGFAVSEEAAYHVGRTMFETDRLPKKWVEACSAMDEVWVPTDFNLDTFVRAGVRKEKLVKIPGSIDIHTFDPAITEPAMIEGKKGFNFLSVFEWSERKGYDVLLKAYFEEFSAKDDVCLFLRTYLMGRTDSDDMEEICRRVDAIAHTTGKPINEVPRYRILSTQIPLKALPALYKAMDAFVAPSRGEGWGRPHMEAMAMQLPCIATNWSGNTEFMTNKNSYLIDVESLKPITKMEIPLYIGHQWAEPSVSHLRTLMRRVFTNREEAKAKASQARKDIVEKYSHEAVSAIVIERLRQIESKIASRAAVPQEKIKSSVIWEGAPFANHSLSVVNREICSEIVSAGVDLSIVPFGQDHFKPGKTSRYAAIAQRRNAQLSDVEVHVRHHWPPNLEAPTNGRWVFMQPWEFGSLPKSWVEKIVKEVDEVWAYTNYVRDVYVKSGVPADRVAVVPAGFNPEQFHPGARPTKLRTKKGFKFLFVGGTIWRKGIDLLLDAYTNAFTHRDDVCLVIKDMGGDSFYKGQTFRDVILEIQKKAEAPAIEYIERFLPDEELAGLYTTCDILVHPYRGEGFGMPVLEAMACGIPTIVTKGGSTDDFCNEQNSILLNAKRVRFPSMFVGHDETVDYPWVLEPDKNELSSTMKYAVEHREELKSLGARAKCDVHAGWTWKHAAEKCIERIQMLQQRPILRFAAPPPMTNASELLAGSYELVKAKRYADALLILHHLDKSQADNSALHDAANLRGACYLEMNDMTNAKSSFEEALHLQPNSSEACAGLGEVFYCLDLVREAKTMFEHAVAHDESNEAAVKGLAKANFALGLPDDDNSLLVPIERKS